MERRQLTSRFEASDNNLTGVIPYNSPTEITEGGRRFTEVLRRGCFRSAVGQDVICTFNHNADNLLGRTSSGTLTLADSPDGLRWSVTLPDYASDIKEMVKRGDLNGCSFTFTTRTGGEVWTKSTRELTDINLYELGPVVFPAYQASKVGLRSTTLYRTKLESRNRTYLTR